ncbi:MAG: transporter, partial [Bdellovibrio bacteriovorus]
MRRHTATLVASLLVLAAHPASAHHGVAGLGAAGLLGPGAPVEAATSATLPEGKVLTYLKLDHTRYKTFDPDPSNPESDYANYWLGGLGY